MKRLFSIVVTCLILVGMTSIVFAADKNNWDYGVHAVGDMNLTDCTYTPVKTMLNSGNVTVSGNFHTTDGGSKGALTVKVYNATTGALITESRTEEGVTGVTSSFSVPTFYVGQGQKIRLWFDISSASSVSSGPYRRAYIDYQYVMN